MVDKNAPGFVLKVEVIRAVESLGLSASSKDVVEFLAGRFPHLAGQITAQKRNVQTYLAAIRRGELKSVPLENARISLQNIFEKTGLPASAFVELCDGIQVSLLEVGSVSRFGKLVREVTSTAP